MYVKVKKVTRYLAFFVTTFAISLLILSLTLQKGSSNSPQTACSTQNFTGIYNSKANLAFYNGKSITPPSEVKSDLATNSNLNVLGAETSSNKWIEIFLATQTIKAWDGGNLFLESKVSSGLPWFPTPKGEFHIWAKMRYVEMKGGVGALAYDLPNVPFTMFFEGSGIAPWQGYGLHGTYWHNDFGNPHSHGCVNLPTPIAEKLYYWTTPSLADGQNFVRATSDNPGTRIVVHD